MLVKTCTQPVRNSFRAVWQSNK